MNHLKIERKDTGGHTIELDGVDITDNLTAVGFGIHRNQTPNVVFEYACSTIEVDSEIEIVHRCPEELRPL